LETFTPWSTTKALLKHSLVCAVQRLGASACIRQALVN
jgi:hypothetical protein